MKFNDNTKAYFTILKRFLNHFRREAFAIIYQIYNETFSKPNPLTKHIFHFLKQSMSIGKTLRLAIISIPCNNKNHYAIAFSLIH